MNGPASSRPRVGLIGVAGYALTYLRLAVELHTAGRIQLCAAVVIDPREQGAAIAELQRCGAAIYDDYQVMLARHQGALDLCLIPTGIGWHKQMTLAALAAGANVLVEKPLAGSLADAQAIRDAEQASRRFVAVGFQDLYTDEIHRLKAGLAAGIIGSLTSIRMLGLWPRNAEYYSRNDWAGRLFTDGVAVHDSPLNNAFAHFAMLCLFFAGSAPLHAARVVRCTAELLRAHAIESFDTAVIQAELEGNLPLWIGVSHACDSAYDPEIVIEGSLGRIAWRHEGECVLTPTQGPTVILPVQKNDDARRTMFSKVVERLHDTKVFVCRPDLAELHADLIAKIHATADIRLFEPQSLLALDSGLVVSGLTEALRASFERQTSLLASGYLPAIAAQAGN